MKNLFKEGDIVICNSLDGFGKSNYKLDNFTIGKTYRVIGIDLSQDCYVISTNDNTYGIFRDHESKDAAFILGFSLKEEKKPFPEKWAIKFYPEISNWIFNKYNKAVSYGNNPELIFHFPNYTTGVGLLIGNHCKNTVLPDYTEITLQEFLGNVVNKQKETIMENKTVYTTRKDLISILNKDNCGEFNRSIKQYLTSNPYLLDTDKLELSTLDLKRIEKECNHNQKSLLKSIGIEYVEPKPLWNRKTACMTYYNELPVDEQHIHNTMLLMRNWAKFHNELDGFVTDWNDGKQIKYGITISSNRISINGFEHFNSFIFQISVNSKERAEQMLAEFKSDLEKCKF